MYLRVWPWLAVGLLLAVACAPEQIRAVRRFNDVADPARLACLDVNGDGLVDSDDADAGALPDITGDGVVAEDDLELVRQVSFELPNGKPADCGEDSSFPADWQVSEPPALDCAAGDRGLLMLAVGGGAVDLEIPNNAAGARWMVEELSGDLDVPTQIASVAPGINGTSETQPNAEDWAFAFLSQRLRSQPCLKALLLGHSHGGVLVTAVASRLEQDGLSDQIMLTVLVDRATVLYAGDTSSIPQSSPVLNLYLPPESDEIHGAIIDQPNVENINASSFEGPKQGEQGGPEELVTHTTIDNSRDVLREVANRVEILTKAPEW